MLNGKTGLTPSAGFATGNGVEDSGVGCSSDPQTFVSPTEQLSVGSVLIFFSFFFGRNKHFLGDLQLQRSYLIWFWFLYSSNHSSTRLGRGPEILQYLT